MVSFLSFVLLLIFVLSNSSYLFIIGGVILFSAFLFMSMLSNRFVFFGLIFIIVYSGRMLLLVLYVSAMMGDYEVQGKFKFNFLIFFFYLFFFNLGLYDAFDFYGGFTYYGYRGGYLGFCTFCLRISLISVLNLLLEKNY